MRQFTFVSSTEVSVSSPRMSPQRCLQVNKMRPPKSLWAQFALFSYPESLTSFLWPLWAKRLGWRDFTLAPVGEHPAHQGTPCRRQGGDRYAELIGMWLTLAHRLAVGFVLLRKAIAPTQWSFLPLSTSLTLLTTPFLCQCSCKGTSISGVNNPKASQPLLVFSKATCKFIGSSSLNPPSDPLSCVTILIIGPWILRSPWGRATKGRRQWTGLRGLTRKS